MRHATVWSLDVLFRWLPEDANGYGGRHACNWEKCDSVWPRENTFSASSCNEMLGGQKVDLPTCPECAVLVDLAIQLREESQSIL